MWNLRNMDRTVAAAIPHGKTRVPKMKTTPPLLISSLAALALFGRASMPRGLGPLQLVESVDTQRYLGRWYEIARFTHRFEKSLVGVTAEYSIRDDGGTSR